MWNVILCFFFRGEKTAALWSIDLEFEENFVMPVKPDVLKRTGTDCTKNPGVRPYAVLIHTLVENKPVLFFSEFVEEFVAKFGGRAFMFSADPYQVSGTD